MLNIVDMLVAVVGGHILLMSMLDMMVGLGHMLGLMVVGRMVWVVGRILDMVVGRILDVLVVVVGVLINVVGMLAVVAGMLVVVVVDGEAVCRLLVLLAVVVVDGNNCIVALVGFFHL